MGLGLCLSYRSIDPSRQACRDAARREVVVVRVETLRVAARAKGPLPVGHGLLRGELRLGKDGGPPARVRVRVRVRLRFRVRVRARAGAGARARARVRARASIR